MANVTISVPLISSSHWTESEESAGAKLFYNMRTVRMWAAENGVLIHVSPHALRGVDYNYAVTMSEVDMVAFMLAGGSIFPVICDYEITRT